MSAENQIPDPEKLRKYLKNALEKLNSNKDAVGAGNYQFKEGIDIAYRTMDNSESNNWSLELKPYLAFEITSTRDFPYGCGQARIGAKIDVSDGYYNHFSTTLLLVSDNQSEASPDFSTCCLESHSTDFHVVERIHWDIDTGGDGDGKPWCHVQIGGKLSDDAFEEYEDVHYCSNGLDKPRIPHPPMDPILVFHLLINEYKSMEPFDQDHWRGIVSKGEETLWNPYFIQTHGMTSSDDLISDLLRS